MFIDFRNRPPTPEYLAYFQKDRTWAISQKVGGQRLSQAFVEGSVPLWLAELQEAGIAKAVVNGRNSPGLRQGNLTFLESKISNDRLASLQAAYPDAVVAFGGIDVSGATHDPVAETRRCITDLHLFGIFIEPQRALPGYPDDERVFPVYDACTKLGVPVMVMSGPYAGTEIELTRPEHIDRVANAFPDLRIVCGHGCWPYVHEVIAVAFKHPNVFVSPDVYTFVPGGDAYIQAANGFMQDQLLFGTAYPIRHMLDTVNDYRAFQWKSTEVFEKVMWRNAARLLGLDSSFQ